MFFSYIIIFASTALFGAIFTCFVCKTVDIYLKRRKYRHIPGPPIHGILGFYLDNYLNAKFAEKENVKFMDLVHSNLKWNHITIKLCYIKFGLKFLFKDAKIR